MENAVMVYCIAGLSPEHFSNVDGLVAKGVFATDSEVFAAGLQALRERDNEIESWLHDEVAPTYDRMQADPERGLSAAAVGRRLQARHEERLRADRRCSES